jgi:soluble lytic murein transglycosylase-like protein
MSGIFHHIGRRLTIAAGLAALPAMAGESAILSNGFHLHADRHEVVGDSVKLYCGDGFTVMPASQIVSFEKEDDPAPAVAAVAPVVPIPAAKEEPPAALAPAAPQPLDPRNLADDAARRNKLPEALIRSIIHAESGFQPDAISPKGAIGLMQLMPGTAAELHADPRDPKQNVDAGTAYLRALLVKYASKDDQIALAVAAYNAGPGAVDRYNGVPPYRETRDYVIRVLTEYQHSLAQPVQDGPASGR